MACIGAHVERGGRCGCVALAWRRCAGCNAVCLRGVVAVNGLGAEGMAALAPALGKLVSLTSLDLRST